MTEKQLRQKFIDQCKKYAGIKESNNGHKIFVDMFNNFIKTNTIKLSGLPGSGLMQLSYPWCACYASCMGIECGAAMKYIPVDMSCTNMIHQWKALGRWEEKDDFTPEMGDYIYFDNQGSSSTESTAIGTVDHVGIVQKVENGMIYTIEGNSSDMVNQRAFKVNAPTICGFGRPDFAAMLKDSAIVKYLSSQAATQEIPSVGVNTEITTPYATVRKGNTGSTVKQMQEYLIKLGYPCGSSGADGDFGTGTYNAVIKYQKAKGLTADGVCGTNTWTSLKKDISALNSSTTTTSRPTIKKGMVSADVKVMQKQLIALGYSCGASGADGGCGINTVSAIKAFQKANGLVVDGVCGKNTWAKLDALYANIGKQQKMKVTASSLNVRKSATTSSAVVKVLLKNAIVYIVEKSNGWGRLADGSGWVSLTYVVEA